MGWKNIVLKKKRANNRVLLIETHMGKKLPNLQAGIRKKPRNMINHYMLN